MDEPGRFNASRNKFLAADLAFLASGASEDGRHTIEADKFFKQFHDLYDSLPKGPDGQTVRREFGDSVRTLIFDLVRNMSPSADQGQ
jgi:hypothetical protein